jgi:hypothetical protein
MATCSSSNWEVDHLRGEDKDCGKSRQGSRPIIKALGGALKGDSNKSDREQAKEGAHWKVYETVRDMQFGNQHDLILLQMICNCKHLAIQLTLRALAFPHEP